MAKATPKSRAPTSTTLRRVRQNRRVSKSSIPAIEPKLAKAQITRKRKSANEEYRDLKRRAEKLGFVVHHSKFCSTRSVNVPSEHQARFEHIQALGRFQYHSYGLQPSPETVDKPWQLTNRHKAQRLSELAIRCRKENRNEAGWRAEVEFQLFERFNIEVAWYAILSTQNLPPLLTVFSKRCRKRIWRSEIEVNSETGNNRAASLQERQARREDEPCRCGPEWRMDNMYGILRNHLPPLLIPAPVMTQV
jgi:hypothetical protein